LIQETKDTFDIYISSSTRKVLLSILADSLFQDDQLFDALEECHSYLSDKSLSKTKPESWGKQDSNYSQIRTTVQEIISQFQDNEIDLVVQDKRKASFFVLDFITSKYELKVMEVEKGDRFEEKTRVYSGSAAALSVPDIVSQLPLTESQY
jgi:hypothetical protein